MDPIWSHGNETLHLEIDQRLEPRHGHHRGSRSLCVGCPQHHSGGARRKGPNAAGDFFRMFLSNYLMVFWIKNKSEEYLPFFLNLHYILICTVSIWALYITWCWSRADADFDKSQFGTSTVYTSGYCWWANTCTTKTIYDKITDHEIFFSHGAPCFSCFHKCFYPPVLWTPWNWTWSSRNNFIEKARSLFTTVKHFAS